MTHDPGLFETMYSLRSMRRLKPDPVPEALIWKVIEAGTKAPSGGNSQPWRFLVVQDAELKRFIQERYKRAWDLYVEANAAAAAKAPPPPEAMEKRMRLARAATHLAHHLHEAPVLLLVCMIPRDLTYVQERLRERHAAGLYASIFPAVQNMLLACRAHGLGATLTTLHLLHEDEIKERLGIPAEVETVALLPIGYPEGTFGPTAREPVQDVTYWDGWDQRRARPE